MVVQREFHYPHNHVPPHFMQLYHLEHHSLEGVLLYLYHTHTHNVGYQFSKDLQ